MKKLLLFFSLGLIFFLAGCDIQFTDTEIYQGVEYTLHYPSTRVLQEEDTTGTIRLLGPWDSIKYRLRPNIIIYHEIEELPPTMTTVEDFYKGTKSTFNSSHYTFISKEDININCIPAIKHVFEFYSKPRPDQKVMEIYLVKNKKVFILDYSAEQGNFDEYKKDAEEIMQSFIWK